MSPSDIKDVKLSVSKTFEIDDQHVDVSLYHDHEKTGFLISINHPSTSYLNFRMLTKAEGERVDCKVFGLTVTHCELDPKLPPCAGCPLNPSKS